MTITLSILLGGIPLNLFAEDKSPAEKAILLDDTKLGCRKLLIYSIGIGFSLKKAVCDPIRSLADCGKYRIVGKSVAIDGTKWPHHWYLAPRRNPKINLLLEYVYPRYSHKQPVANAKALPRSAANDTPAHGIKYKKISI